MSRLLVVDDEENIRSIISKYAKYENFEVVEAKDGLEALNLCYENDFDLIIMDIMMPNLDGFSASKEIKKIKDIPIILLSALGEEYDKIHGFELGIDDYVVKPFSNKELMMRVHAVLKRSNKNNNNILEIDNLKVDLSARVVTINDEVIKLSLKEYELLVYLINNRGIALTREQLLHNVWGYDFFGDDRTLDTHIKLLRKSLGEYSKYIVTIRGVGYRFEKD